MPMLKIVTAGTLAACALLLVGCAPEASDGPSAVDNGSSAEPQVDWQSEYHAWEPETIVTSPPISDGEALELRDQWLSANFARSIEDRSPLPEVPLERWVDDDERWQVLVDCLNDSGYPATISEDEAGFSLDFGSEPTEEQSSAYDIAVYACAARFTPHAKLLVPWGAEQYAVEYEYFTTFYLDCLEAQGIEILRPAPSKEAFIAARLAGDTDSDAFWIPADPTEWSSDEVIPPDASAEIALVCPQTAPATALFG